MSYLDILMSRGRQGTLFDQLAYRKMVGGGSATLIGTDTEPYLYRQSPSLGAYKTERDEIVGVSVGFNQLVNTTDTSVTVPSGHKYIARINGTWSVGTSSGTALTVDGSNNDMVIDLTAMLGSTIADYIVTQGNTNGVAFFRKYFGDDFYPFDSGSIRSVEGLVSHDTVGKNLFNMDACVKGGTYFAPDGSITSQDYISVLRNLSLPKGTYTISWSPVMSYAYVRINVLDANGNFLRREATLTAPPISFTLQGSDAQIEVAFDEPIDKVQLESGSTATAYEPYRKSSYPLDSTVTLRGLLKLEDGKLKADGDIYKASGEVVRNWGERAYQSGDESLADAITDGTTTVYKLTTPTTEQAQPFAKTQKVSPSGTEEYVTTSVVPVGHNTEYYG